MPQITHEFLYLKLLGEAVFTIYCDQYLSKNNDKI